MWLAWAHDGGWTPALDLAGHSGPLVLPAVTVAVPFGFRGVVAFLVYGLTLGALALPFGTATLVGVTWNAVLALSLGWSAAWGVQGAERAVEKLRRSILAVVLLDLDGLKAANDSRGHEAGDRLLSGFAAALRSALGPGEAAYRLGGDEYGVFCWEERLDAVRSTVAGATARRRRSGFPEMGAPIGSASGAGVGSIGALVRLPGELMYREKRGKPQRRMQAGEVEG